MATSNSGSDQSDQIDQPTVPVDPQSSLPPEILAKMAYEHPESRAWIISQPGCYPELKQWLLEVDPSLASNIPNADVAYPPPPAPDNSDSTYTVTPSSPRKRRRWPLTVIAAVLVLAIVGGGAYYLLVGKKLGGSSSPTAAAEKLVDGISDTDVLSLVGSLAPSEVDGLVAAFQSVQGGGKGSGQQQSDAGGSEQIDYQQSLNDLLSSVTITTHDLEFEEQSLVNDEVVRVVLTDGSFDVGIDRSKFDTAVEPLLEQQARLRYESDPYVAENYTSEDIQWMIDSDVVAAKEDIDEALTNLQAETFYVRDLVQNELEYRAPETLSVVTVKEGRGWYVSPMMTTADQFYMDHSEDTRGGLTDFSLGGQIVEAQEFGSPEEAASAFASAMAGGDPMAVARTVSLPERRMISVYGPYLMDNIGASSVWSRSVESVEIERSDFASYEQGSHRIVQAENLTFRVLHDYSYTTFEVDENCINETYFYDGSSASHCLDNPNPEEGPVWVVSKLGLELEVVANKEKTGWVIAPLDTAYLHGGTMLSTLLQLESEGRLGELAPPD